MTGLVVDSDKCVGCGLCVRACPNGGIRLHDIDPGNGKLRKYAMSTASCTYCGLCVGACPKDAILVLKEGEPVEDGDGFLVVCEADESGRLIDVSRELLWKANELAAKNDTWVQALVIGCKGEPEQSACDDAIEGGADEVTTAWNHEDPWLDSELAARCAVDLIQELKPEAVLFGATDFGRELAPQVAQRLQTGLTADCTVLEVDEENGLLLQTRPAFGGNLMATIQCPARRPQMATVRPGIFSKLALSGDPLNVPAAHFWEPVSRRLVQVLEAEPAGNGETVTDAEVLVVAGRGVRDKAGLALCERLAGLLGGKLGCTRPLVEQGWLDRSHQVGQTGCSVAPRLLVSVGVSGAVQHLAGISGAQCVVAINEDAGAPIFSVAQYAAVGDCREVLPALIAQFEGDSANGRP